MKTIFLLALMALAQARPEPESKIDPRLLTRQSDKANIFVHFEEGTREVLEAIMDTRFDTREDRLDALHTGLTLLADRVQENVKALLFGQFNHVSLWVTNQIYVKEATMDLILNLANMEEVARITQEEIYPLETILAGPIIIGGRQEQEEWGIRMIRAPEARRLLDTTNNATEVIVSTIDTGARHTHETLRENWLGEYGWFDPYDNNALPMDLNGHGTHTTATIAGSKGVGVYPDAKWTACRGCATASCAQNALLQCAQFIVCPTLPGGSEPNCHKAPHLVSNSWGGGRGNTWFDEAIAAFHAAQIIPLFSQGNSGPSCGSANSPGDRDVIGVGSTTDRDDLSSFSSVGPTTDGRMKPEITAPGSSVLSAYNTADDAYRALSGTSMACPHAAGLTSLLVAYNPDLKYDDVKFFMHRGVDTDSLVSNGKVCSDIPDDKFPNHHYGFGRINAFKSLTGLIESSKKK